MSRAGRKRKSGARHPGGQLKAKPKPDLKIRTSRQPHRRALKADDRLDERAESPLGRLFLRGKIDNNAYDAGARYAFVVGEYRSTIEGPRATQGSGRGMDNCIAEACNRSRRSGTFDPDTCPCFRRKSRYDDAYEMLAREGRAILMVVNRIVVHRGEPAEEDIVYLVAGLSILARHFGLTRAPRRAHHENAH